MRQYFSFWFPPLLRLLGILLISILLGVLFNTQSGLSFALIAVSLLLLLQLYYLHRLASWIDDPKDIKLPDGWGAWESVFSRLYRLRRDDAKHQTELTEWLARFRQAMHLLPDGVVIMNDTLLEWCNPTAEQHLGLSLERDKDMRVTHLVRTPAFIDYTEAGRYEQPLVLTIRERRLIVQIIPFENQRQIVVTHDTTESERIEMMRRDFIANASHELRTPLTVINGFLEIARDQPDLDAATRNAHVTLMSEQGQRMQNLVEDMLTLTRLESIEYPVHPEPINIAQLLEKILQEARALSAGRHTITLKIDGPDIEGGLDEIHSAFSNLVSNAIRYTPQEGHIELKWEQTDVGPQFVVSDTGIGIAPEHIVRLTERFYRVDKSRSRETQGTGLGLAIVKHVLLRHNAVLTIDSQPGKGSVFRVQFCK